MLPSTRQWTQSELTQLTALHARGKWDSAYLATQFKNCTVADIEFAVANIANDASLTKPKPVVQIDKEHADADVLKDLDPVQRLFYDHARQYNIMGESLKALATLMSMNMGAEEFRAWVQMVHSQWSAIPKTKTDEFEFYPYLMEAILFNFVLVKKPLLVPHGQPK